MKVTIYSIAKAANVSHTTVSRVLNKRDDPFISKATRDRIIDIAQKMGYRPNVQAQALVSGKTFNITLYCQSIQERSGLHFARMLEAIETKCRSIGYRLLVCGDLDAVMGESFVDGILALDDPVVLDTLTKNCAVPYVVVWNGAQTVTPNCIYWNDQDGANKAIQYLASLGHKKILGLFGDTSPDSSPLNPKVCGFRQAAEEVEAISAECFGSLSEDQFENGYLLMRKLLQDESKDFTAVFARNDFLALGAVKAIKEAGKKVPMDVSVIGYNDTVLARCADPGLTSVHTPIAEAGVKAVDLLIDMIRDGTKECPGTNFPASLTLRDSCARIDKLIVARADFT